MCWTVGVFIDLKRAFDTIDHKILMSNLEHYGIRGVAYSWLKSYLDNRYQYVNVNTENSELQKGHLWGTPRVSAWTQTFQSLSKWYL